jgi:hypothetical protein
MLGLVGWLLPIVGVILGILALVFGSIALRSQKRTFALVGIFLGVPVLAVSIFFWVQNAQAILSERENASRTAATSGTAQAGAISTPCYTTKVPSELTVTQKAGSCTFEAVNTKRGEQIVVKVLAADTLDASGLEKGAQEDAQNVVSMIPGGSITEEVSTTFAGSPAYKVGLAATDGSAGVIYYVYKPTDQGKLIIVLRTKASGDDYELDSIEQSWSWR